MFDTFWLKIIACFFMIIDHIGVFFLESSTIGYVLTRIVGRISAPIFWFCLSVGFKHTSNKIKYMSRLFYSALIMGVGNCIVGNVEKIEVIDFSFVSPNIFVLMFFSSVILFIVDKYNSQIKKQYGSYEHFINCLIVLVSAGVIVLFADYGLLALLSIFIFYYIKIDWLKSFLFIATSIIVCIATKQFLQVFMIISLLFIMNYKNKKPKNKSKLFFYIFYPAHMWLFSFVSTFI